MSQLTTFSWTARDTHGQIHSGEMQAKTSAQVKSKLRSYALRPTRIRRRRQWTIKFGGFSRHMKPTEITRLLHQLSTLLEAGIPIAKALQIITGDQTNPALNALLNHLHEQVETGHNLSEAMRSYSHQFDELDINMIAIGEQCGLLETMLGRLAAYREKSDFIRARALRATFYPLAVIVVAALVTSVLLLYVIPMFEQLFLSAGSELPSLTRFVIHISHGLSSRFDLLLAGLLLLSVIGRFSWNKSSGFRQLLNRLALNLPVIGTLLHQAALARYARTLATTFGAGIPITEALAAVARASDNPLFALATERMRRMVSAGEPLHLCMRNESLFPNLLKQMTMIGEETGMLDRLMEHIADYYEERLDQSVENLGALLEPLIIVIIGCIVGILVISMYLPVFHLGDAL